MYNEFWKSYKNKTEIEKKAIASIHHAMQFLFVHLPERDIVAVYIKGSFVTREMNKKSDVDIVPIVTTNSVLAQLKKARDEHKEVMKPAELLPISLEELKRNKNARRRGMKGRPDTFLRDLEHHKVIYGKALRKSDYPMRKRSEIFIFEVHTLRNKTIALHKKGEFGFQQLIKQLFWIVYHEQKELGKLPPRTWNGLRTLLKIKIISFTEHIILECIRRKTSESEMRLCALWNIILTS